ncbi:MAG: hypothetical protein COW24_05285 [Candidatus Kerfeldbacteria bacterium CG15_BIG_FIL_POST_REV_8_21_14_020_45_12]|uniref:FAD dependent oxidoreductase domain-containing protein n=1 Tax=Candidatus Kerfeldbacteria bacterium CG15_BIG_FIL_POST_REV_8_21_14_020_45_12 TaxID=2014247 RepID=A0A2M7H2M4_9BACT|nr:MAG: hypothetical protein COW24_05285 [Candidatus Kerfeldbacteria bacterium CG15_BIG_FIL_POST_REV_8_21_14_020_45_12]PJA93477.1 MAG: hypothetical protein CO132_02500 [Candidatus Kerfeldbacteria bacterium CG_4_9_14_3_um_filter_45_8]
MQQLSYWHHHTSRPPRLNNLTNFLPSQADIIIVGAGISGLSLAHHLQESGKKVVVLEANQVGYGATAYCSGMLTNEPGEDYIQLLKKHGVAHVRRVSDSLKFGINAIEDYLLTQDHNTDYRRVDSLYVGYSNKDTFHLEAEFQVRNAAGLRSEMLNKTQLTQSFPWIKGSSAIATAGNAEINPLAFLYSLADIAINNGTIVVEDCLVEKIKKNKGSWSVYTTKGEISSPVVSINCDAELEKISKGRVQPVLPISEAIIVTEPVSELADLASSQLLWNNFELFDYARILPEGRIMMGSGQTLLVGKELEVLKSDEEKLMTALQDFFELTSTPKIEDIWRKSFGVTSDDLPFIGPIENNLYLAGGYNGHGLVLGFLAGELLASHILNRPHPYQDLFHPQHRKNLKSLGYKFLALPKLRSLAARILVDSMRRKDKRNRA